MAIKLVWSRLLSAQPSQACGQFTEISGASQFQPSVWHRKTADVDVAPLLFSFYIQGRRSLFSSYLKRKRRINYNLETKTKTKK
jgi:hypothetical protein